MTVLCYHAVDPAWSAPISVDPPSFTEQCSWLARRGVAPLETLVASGRRGRDVAITFDDGFASVYEHAFTVLRRHGVPATVFVVAGTLSAEGRTVDWLDHPPETGAPATLSAEQILEMRDAGVRFGSHGYAHADLTALDPEGAERDLRESREPLEELLHEPVPFVAYPRGRHDERVREVTRRAGYTHGFALPERREVAGPYAWPRVGVYAGNGIGTLRIKTNPVYLPLRTGLRSVALDTRAAIAARR
jgi:peptidoglycan/xylan/chitin deacetylase (PgdA/CDA1 family)